MFEVRKTEHPKIVGDRTTAFVLARLLEMYDIVLLPFGENQRYDLVVDDGSRFLRIQCKTGRLRDGVIRFAACSVTYHHPNRNKTQYFKQDYRGQTDYFGVYCPQTSGVYLVPAAIIGRREGCLRVAPSRNAQSKGIRWAKDFEIGSMACREIRSLDHLPG